MGIKRIGKHLLEHRWRVRRIFTPAALARIEQAIKAGEATHSGQVRFVVEGALDGAPLFHDQSARERALDIFSQLRIWDTAHNNGVLIYLLFADHNVEIVADRGIDAKVGFSGWEKICAGMETEFKAEFRGRRDQGDRGGVAGTGEVFSGASRRAERTAGCAGGDLVSSLATSLRAVGSQWTIIWTCIASGTRGWPYAFTDGRWPTRSNQAAILVLAGFSGWPIWLPKSIQQYSIMSASVKRSPHTNGLPAIWPSSHCRRLAAISLRPGEASGAQVIRFWKNFSASPKR